MSKRLAILGATGSIGRQTLEVVRGHRDKLTVVGLAAGGNLSLLAQQMAEFDPKLVSLPNLDQARKLFPQAQALTLEEMAAHPEVDLVMVATVGRVGLEPTRRALESAKTVALANKEVLVMAGELVMAAAQEHDARLLPVDSEPSALWQCLEGEKRTAVARLILTASGGAFRDHSPAELERVTPQEALRHPTWVMGPKVTVDSATLMNKGMEAIEASWFFGIPLERIGIVMHRQSIVHSLVEFNDGAVKAVLSPPDMRLPIQYSLSYPERWGSPELPRLPWRQPWDLNFAPPPPETDDRFPCLRLALEAGKRGGTYPAALCGADEVAVERFLAGEIGFMDIPRLVEATLSGHRGQARPSWDDIRQAEAEARQFARAWKR